MGDVVCVGGKGVRSLWVRRRRHAKLWVKNHPKFKFTGFARDCYECVTHQLCHYQLHVRRLANGIAYVEERNREYHEGMVSLFDPQGHADGVPQFCRATIRMGLHMGNRPAMILDTLK